MADCVLKDECLFFNDRMESYPVATERLKREYCRGESAGCARYMVFRVLGRERIPQNLFPHQRSRARLIIEEST